jgi:hypothetical protein
MIFYQKYSKEEIVDLNLLKKSQKVWNSNQKITTALTYIESINMLRDVDNQLKQLNTNQNNDIFKVNKLKLFDCEQIIS